MNWLFFIAKTKLNYSREEFFNSTFKEIVMLIEELNKLYEKNETEEDGYVERKVSIDEIPFL